METSFIGFGGLIKRIVHIIIYKMMYGVVLEQKNRMYMG
jgi:hypothetical protein